MQENRVPTEADWGDYKADLDQKWAHDMFAGHTNNEMRQRFCENVLEATEDLRWMPPIPFRYYVIGFRDFVLAREFQPGDDGSDAASCFINLVQQKLDGQRDYIVPIMPELLAALHYITENQGSYGAAVEIYGDFRERLQQIEYLYAQQI
jgi:hypothetical protein